MAVFWRGLVGIHTALETLIHAEELVEYLFWRRISNVQRSVEFQPSSSYPANLVLFLSRRFVFDVTQVK